MFAVRISDCKAVERCNAVIGTVSAGRTKRIAVRVPLLPPSSLMGLFFHYLLRQLGAGAVLRNPRFGASVMETGPRSADKMGLASTLTALNVVVASGFSIAGLIKPELVLPAGATPTDASAIFAMYAAARTIPLTLITMVAIYNGSASLCLFWAFLQASSNLLTRLWACFSTTLEKPSGHFSLLSFKCTPSQFFGRHRKQLQTDPLPETRCAPSAG